MTASRSLHPLVVLDALLLHPGDRLATFLELLLRQDRPRVVEGGLDDGHHVEGEGRRLGVEQLEGGERERRQRLVEREVRLQVDGEPVGAVDLLDHPGVDEGPGDGQGSTGHRELSGAGFVVVVDERADVLEGVPTTGDDGQHHRVGDPHPGRHRLGLGADQPLEGRLPPGHEALGCLLPLDLVLLLRVVPGLGDGTGVLDVVLGRFGDDVALGVVPGPSGTAGDLVELTGRELAHLGAVELRQAGEQHGADRHVDADAQGVGAADDGQQAALGELFDQASVLRQHAGVVDADARADQA